ncbi:hypothetical protein A2814_02435 [Candidatus Nomurabacteria bacterium RIFCSPHIGHO2_01_FULL_38_19]|uniref:Uncharacterized protein n=1 Tax=Candidatus Nomurabacteria bacterium RIFCSPHIGHO2_01_FULL_38_19 TaxID=1801732 RepID=A0A1F6URF0_9BACT|nr:MAG: hypothetical protein A2814_02435 [Candidatus Nomurabacteria bacterium RIFCSPHIGHO2_01_FULL_38_19]
MLEKNFIKENSKLPEAKNMVKIETTHAVYRLLYGSHVESQDDSMMQGTDGLLVEGTLDLNELQDSPDRVLGFVFSTPQMQKLIENARDHKKPVYFVDRPFDRSLISSQSKDTWLEIGEFIGTLAFMTSATKGLLSSAKNNERISRRDFLKAGAKTVAAGYLSTPYMQAWLGGQNQEDTLLRKADRAVIAVNDILHPEMYGQILDLRNNIMAEKAEFVALKTSETLNRKPIFVFALGSDHTRVEIALQRTTEQRVAQIKSGYTGNMSDLRKIVKLEFLSLLKHQKDKFKISPIEDPNL